MRINKGTFLYFSMFLLFLLSGCGERKIPDKALSDYLQAKKSYEKGDLEKSETLFKELSKKYSNFYQARFMYGKSLYFKGHADQALAVFRKTKESNPEYYDAAFWYARLLFQTGRADAAEAEFTRLYSLNSRDPGILYQLALIKTTKDDIPAALDFLRRAALFKDEYAQVFLHQGKLLYSYGQYGKTLESLNQCLAMLDENSTLRPAVVQLISSVKKDLQSENK